MGNLNVSDLELLSKNTGEFCLPTHLHSFSASSAGEFEEFPLHRLPRSREQPTFPSITAP